MRTAWYTSKTFTVLMHVLFWALFIAAPYLLHPVTRDDVPKSDMHKSYLFFLVHLFHVVQYIIFFYLNINWLTPRLFNKRRYAHYALALLAALLFMMLTDRLFIKILVSDFPYSIRNFFVFNFLPFLFVCVTSLSYRLIRDRIKDNEIRQERENENLKTELSFLRSQVSPHFMFNVLNNMVALARKKSDLLEPALLKLSALMRYMLYETDEEKVALEKEVEYLRSYIDLQHMRFGKNITIETDLAPVAGGYAIEPMLLIPFVENAFKHGTGMVMDAQIFTSLHVENGLLHFKTRNRYADDVPQAKDKTSGIGMVNVTRRLNLLYPQKHELHITKQNGWYEVYLTLQLH